MTIKGKPAFIKSKKALSYARDFLRQIPASAKQSLDGDIRFTVHIYYASRRPDLDESLILDLLQDIKKKGVLISRGVYNNDRQVKERHVYWGLDKKNPRVEIEVELINKV